jgi:hypothetical protein
VGDLAVLAEEIGERAVGGDVTRLAQHGQDPRAPHQAVDLVVGGMEDDVVRAFAHAVPALQAGQMFGTVEQRSRAIDRAGRIRAGLPERRRQLRQPVGPEPPGEHGPQVGVVVVEVVGLRRLPLRQQRAPVVDPVHRRRPARAQCTPDAGGRDSDSRLGARRGSGGHPAPPM